MDDRALENVVRIYAEFKEAYAALPPQPMGPIQADGVMIMRGGRFMFIRDEALGLYRKLVSKWATSEWKTKWSDKYRTEKAQTAMVEAFDERDGGLRIFRELANEFDEEPAQFTVFIPISGIDLKVPSLQIGEVEVLRMTRDLADELIATASEMVADKSLQVKTAILDFVTKSVNELENVTCLKLIVRGDSTKAQADAEHTCLQVIDILQVIVGLFISLDAEVRVDFRSFDAVGYRPIIFVSADGSSVTPHKARFGAAGACEITPYVLERLKEYEFETIFDIVRLPEDKRSEVETLILRALHWFADGDLQRNPENQLQSYVTCLDMFFATKDGEVTRSVQEGVAHLMGLDTDARREIYDFVGEVYDYRSRASHTGEQFELPELTLKCRGLVINFIVQMVKRRAEFPTKKAIKEWALAQRLG